MDSFDDIHNIVNPLIIILSTPCNGFSKSEAAAKLAVIASDFQLHVMDSERLIKRLEEERGKHLSTPCNGFTPLHPQ